jgi:hypothetical protein
MSVDSKKYVFNWFMGTLIIGLIAAFSKSLNLNQKFTNQEMIILI